MATIFAGSRTMSGHILVSLPNICTANAWVNCKFLLHVRGELFKDWTSSLQLSLCALDRFSIWFSAWRQVWRKEMCFTVCERQLTFTKCLILCSVCFSLHLDTLGFGKFLAFLMTFNECTSESSVCLLKYCSFIYSSQLKTADVSLSA